MSLYDAYLEEIENRKTQGLKPKPIDNGALVGELIAQIRTRATHTAPLRLISSSTTLPGTTSAAGVSRLPEGNRAW